jgi:hypothetical protein
MAEVEDTGKHYRFSYRVKVTHDDADRGYIDIKMDPYRVIDIYKITSPWLQHLIKKVLNNGDRGHNTPKEELKDIMCAAQRGIEMIEENERNATVAKLS